MIDMIAGALVFSYLIAGAYFIKFWKTTKDRIFIHFAVAFWLFFLNQLATSIPIIARHADGYEYLLRVVGFIVIIIGIVDKNLASPRSHDRTS